MLTLSSGQIDSYMFSLVSLFVDNENNCALLNNPSNCGSVKLIWKDTCFAYLHTSTDTHFALNQQMKLYTQGVARGII